MNNPSYRVIELRYECGYDDGVSASGYYIMRNGLGHELARGNFVTDGSGTFQCYDWPEQTAATEEVWDNLTWDDGLEDLDKDTSKE